MGRHLTEEQAREIREEYSGRPGEPRYGQRRSTLVHELAERYGTTARVIRRVLAGKTFPDPSWKPRRQSITLAEACEIRAAHEARPGKHRYEPYRGAFVEQLAEQYEVAPRVIRKVLTGRTF